MKKITHFYGVYILVALLVMLPLLLPGFILTMDMNFTPTLPMPEHITSSYLFYAALHVLNLVIPGDILQKILLLTILIASGIGAHRLIRAVEPDEKIISNWGVVTASIFYIVNPFTYSRFMAGQFAVLLGYALLPWFAHALIMFGRNPTLRRALLLGGLTTLIGIVSIHTLGELAILTAVAGCMALWKRRSQFKQYVRLGMVTLGVFIVASSYWLVPLAIGQGSTAQTIGQFTSADTQAYATVGDNVGVKTFNVLRLQGFWAEAKGLYALPQDRAVLWGLMAILIIALIVTGAVATYKRSRVDTTIFICSGILAVILAVSLGDWVRHIPLLAGYREPHKFIGLLALSYVVFLAPGITTFLAWARAKAEALYIFSAIFLLMLPLLFTNVMLGGFGGQLHPKQYPASWFTVNDTLERDHDNFTVLFLPWHQYMSFAFSERIIANPAGKFFAKPVLVSIDPEIGKVTSSNPQQVALTRLLKKPDNAFAKNLASENIKYIILAKDLDYQKYNFLQQQHQLTSVLEAPDIQLYVNQAWRAQP
jgi:small basic protein